MPRGSLPALLYQIESRLGEPLPERIPAYARVAWVIKHLDNLLADVTLLRSRIAELEQDKRRLTWALRAIDCRLHKETEGESIHATVYLVSARTLRQMCNVAVSATSERPTGQESQS